jgi:hypothetical protein
MFEFSCSVPRREETASVNVCKIAVRKLVPTLRIHRISFIHAEVPLRVFGKSVQTNKLIFRISRRSVLAPCAFAITDKMSFLDQPSGERYGIFVYRDAATRLSARIADCVEKNDERDPNNTSSPPNGRFHSRKSKRLPQMQNWQTIFGLAGRSTAW